MPFLERQFMVTWPARIMNILSTTKAESWARALIGSRRRFKALLAFFKVVDYAQEDQADRLKKVRFLYEAVRDACRRLY